MLTSTTLDRFYSTYTKLVVREFQKRFHATPINAADSSLSAQELRFITLIASQLALGTDFSTEQDASKWKLIAYDAVTRLASLSQGTAWTAAAQMVLSRLGNFPSIGLLKQHHPDLADGYRYPKLLALESLVREYENTVTLNESSEYVLTDFQIKLFNTLKTRQPVSVSAPTSAGKSFVLSIDIVRRLLSRSGPTSIVYLVPTRALIRQVMGDVLKQLRHAGLEDVTVLSAPVLIEEPQLNKGVVYVLTQERLMSLLYSPDGEPFITTLLVDEAQELGDDERGLTLHSAVQHALERFPHIDIFFSSPLIDNPGFILNEFRLHERGTYFTETISPVSQTLIALSPINRKPKQVKVEVLGHNGMVPVGFDTVDFEFRPPLAYRLARTAIAYTQEGETSIIYANGASEAENLATEIAGALPEPEEIADEVYSLIEFIVSHVHPKYSLIECLKKGVAFHYGNMPHIIRGQIEDLIRSKKIRFVCCTSTLLQGVNLPAKNIFIQNPRRGRGKPMTSGDFWNLAGRAGRLKEVFSGNVWCLTPDNWGDDLLNGPRLSQATSAFREAVNDQVTYESILKVIDTPTLPSEVEETKIGEQTFAKIFSEYVLKNRTLVQSHYDDPNTHQRLLTLDRKCMEVKQKITIPQEVFFRNSTISPWRLQALWDYFGRVKDIMSVIPADPFDTGFYKHLENLFRILDEIFFQIGNNSYKYYALLAMFWMQGKTLKEIILNRLRYYEVAATETQEINTHIRDLLEILESILHYKYVKFLRAYSDVLASYLKHTNRESLIDSIKPLHLYIEFGAREAVLLNLISLGLSRTTAILLRKATNWNTDLDRQGCLDKIKNLNLRQLDIPAVCKQEIRELFDLQKSAG